MVTSYRAHMAELLLQVCDITRGEEVEAHWSGPAKCRLILESTFV